MITLSAFFLLELKVKKSSTDKTVFVFFFIVFNSELGIRPYAVAEKNMGGAGYFCTKVSVNQDIKTDEGDFMLKHLYKQRRELLIYVRKR